jgi:hypothetical protein
VKRGCPLLSEGGDGFLVVLAFKREHLEGAGGVEGGAEGLLDPVVDAELGGPQRQRGPVRQAAGEGRRPVVELIVGRDVVDQADAFRLDGGQGVAGEEILLGSGGADGERPDGRSAVTGHDAHADVGVGDGG